MIESKHGSGSMRLTALAMVTFTAAFAAAPGANAEDVRTYDYSAFARGFTDADAPAASMTFEASAHLRSGEFLFSDDDNASGFPDDFLKKGSGTFLANTAAKDAPAGDAGADDAEAVAKKLSNPAGSLASLTLKNQFRLYDGDIPGADDQWNFTALFQPTFPFPLGTTSSGGEANLFIRPAIPFLVDQPTPGVGKFKGVTAIGDIGFDVAYGVTEKSGFIWIVGMVGTLPTATDSRVAGKQLRLGPEFFIGQVTDWGLFGIFPQHQWNVTGWGDGYFSQSQIQPFLNVNLGDGWQFSTQPIIQYNWKQEQWNVPLNAQLAKTLLIGDLPVRVQLEVDYYVERADAFADEWIIGINITPVVPNFINNWIRGL